MLSLARAAPSPFDPVAYLRGEGWLTQGDLASLDRGGVVAKVADTSDRSEVLSVGLMRAHTTPARALQVLQDVDGPHREPWVLGSQRLKDPPYTGELANVLLDRGEVKDLAKCRLHECEIRLPEEAIRRFQGIPVLQGKGEQAQAAFREVLSSYAQSYALQGNDALFRYDNNDDPVRIADSLAKLSLRPLLLSDVAPDVLTYVERYPQDRPPDVQDFLYWTKEKFWLLDVLSLNHMFLVDRASEAGRLILAVSKQLYATHYYESSLGVTAFVEAGSYVVFVNRTRADIRKSGFTWVERTLLRFLVRGRLDARLKHLRKELEAP